MVASSITMTSLCMANVSLTWQWQLINGCQYSVSSFGLGPPQWEETLHQQWQFRVDHGSQWQWHCSSCCCSLSNSIRNNQDIIHYKGQQPQKTESIIMNRQCRSMGYVWI